MNSSSNEDTAIATRSLQLRPRFSLPFVTQLPQLLS